MVHNPRALIAVCLAGLAAQGCATSPPRSQDAVARAEASIGQATGVDSGHTEAATLQVARQKLDDARQAQSKGDQKRAERLARQADLEAQLAAARAQATASEKAANETRTGVDALRRESERNVSPGASTGTAAPTAAPAGPVPQPVVTP
jgi:hypothetical protein